jgi:murein endopeptidase
MELKPESDPTAGWTTLRGLEYLSGVGELMAKKFPHQPLVIGSVSNEKGGYMKPHQSHQNGLDMDLYFFSTNGAQGPFFGASLSGQVTEKFDLAKNWEFFKALVGYRDDWVNVIFLHNTIKQALCKHAKAIGEPINEPNSVAFKTLQKLYPERYPGKTGGNWVYPDTHRNHAHVRLRCPRNVLRCEEKIIGLPKGTSCN